MSISFARPGMGSRKWSLAGLAALLSLAAAPAAQAQVVSPNGQIAYVACGPSNIPFGQPTQCDIWVMNADGTGQVNLTDTLDQYEYAPAWSADGTRIAYASQFTGELFVMDANGANKTLVATGGANAPTWSPGGLQLAFVRNGDVVVVDLTTGSEVIVSQPVDFGGGPQEAEEFEPVWSPDGGRIAYVGVRPETYPDPITGEPQQGAQHEIVISNPDGSGEVVVSAGTPGTDRANFLEEDRAPAWSPDGSMIVFMSQAQVPSCCGPWQIWAVNRDGSSATNLTNDPNVNDLWPSWSPDGTQIIFQRAGGGGYDLWSMPAPTTLSGVAAPRKAMRVRTAAAGGTRLTFDGNAADPDWGRNRDAPRPAAKSYSLFVTVAAARRAGGTVASAAPGIRCGRDCTQPYAPGTRVDLRATPKRGSVFTGWSGACTGAAAVCSVTMVDVRLVKAVFARQP